MKYTVAESLMATNLILCFRIFFLKNLLGWAVGPKNIFASESNGRSDYLKRKKNDMKKIRSVKEKILYLKY